jgi:arsenite methyltransferase
MTDPKPAMSHYGRSDIVANILAALPARPDGVRVKAEELYPFDQLHGRELLASRDHAARLSPHRDDRILDIGCGIGGPARLLAKTYGCRVTGLDITPQFIVAATELTELTGLSPLVHFDQGDATRMPYADSSFDAAICFYVGMNLPDKPAVLAEAHRVLKPGGRLLWTEAMATGAATVTFPLPWASEAAGSHTVTQAGFEAMLKAAGFAIEAVIDETADHVELARAAQLKGIAPPPATRVANETVLGPEFIERRRNYIGNLVAGALVSCLFEARRPS